MTLWLLIHASVGMLLGFGHRVSALITVMIVIAAEGTIALLVMMPLEALVFAGTAVVAVQLAYMVGAILRAASDGAIVRHISSDASRL